LDERGLINKDDLPETAKVSIDDTVLVEQCRRGESLAMERLILKYQNRIYNIIRKMCGNADDAAELTQDTFVKIIESIDGFQGKSSFYTWAFRIAVNLTLNYCKRNSKFAAQSLDGANEGNNGQGKERLREILADTNLPDPAAVAANRELCEIIMRVLMMLDDEQRAVVLLRDVEGMNYAQIAEILNVELGTVKSRISRARGRLKEIMETILQ
jgi:RNA polymerase sigma-70 factor (ECF subfamily)